MSHVFISYTHADKAILDRLVVWLHDHDFSSQQLWYDQHIEGGNNWRDEIATALDESFAVIVIVTASSVKSLYCTYEWAYAMGQGIAILPLVFENLAITDIPSPLASKQFTNCTEAIPDGLKDQILRLRSVPPQVAAINKAIYEAIYDTHRRFYILGWLGERGVRSLTYEHYEEVLSYFAEKSSEAHQSLESLMTDKAFAFSSKQYRHCWTIIDFLKEISQSRHKIETDFHEHLFPRFDTEWLPAFEYFEGVGWWRKAIYDDFQYDLESEHIRLAVFAEIMRVFPLLDAVTADFLIHNASIDRKPE